MKRRQFIIALIGTAAWPLAARAQKPMPLIGLLNSSSAEQLRVDAFIQRFRELGWIEGQTVAIESRWAEGRPERIAEIAAEFVRLKVGVIVTAGAGSVSAVRQAAPLTPNRFCDSNGARWHRPCHDPIAAGWHAGFSLNDTTHAARPR